MTKNMTTHTNKISEKSVEVRTERFEFAHGKSPRGYGLWMFEDYNRNPVETGYGTYAQVKKQAIKKAAEAGLYTIYAGS